MKESTVQVQLSNKHCIDKPLPALNDYGVPEGVLLRGEWLDYIEVRQDDRIVYFTTQLKDICALPLGSYSNKVHTVCPKGTVAVFTQTGLH